MADRPESIIYRTTIHWAALFGPAMLLIIGGISVRTRLVPALVMIVLSVIWGIFSIRNLRLSEFVLMETKLIVRIGFPFKRFYEIPYTTLAGADFFKPALGVILGFGKVMILRKDNKTIVFRLVAKPEDLVEKLKKEIILAHEAIRPESPSSPG
ncbi:MAG: hypothetical protein PHT96_10800 [Syntrophorhabdaceae bacterium]|nr:hypothetical protein [Syntrophorhabdaceae bacterium]MDD4196877.1 hypothetical protein [Syntrophorhabdaceae bacterium]HOC45215.1 hypothetical protein [Syntrophorhabdaceae bacterium]